MECYYCSRIASGICTRCSRAYCREHGDDDLALCYKCRAERGARRAGWKAAILTFFLVLATVPIQAALTAIFPTIRGWVAISTVCITPLLAVAISVAVGVGIVDRRRWWLTFQWETYNLLVDKETEVDLKIVSLIRAMRLAGAREYDKLIIDYGYGLHAITYSRKLVKIGKPAIEYLVQFMGGKLLRFEGDVAEEDVSQGICPGMTLCEIAKKHPKPVVSRLIKCLNHKSRLVRHCVVSTLGTIGDPDAVEPLITVFEEEEDTWVRGEAVIALGKIGDPRAIEPLVRSLRQLTETLNNMPQYPPSYFIDWETVLRETLSVGASAALALSLLSEKTHLPREVCLEAAKILDTRGRKDRAHDLRQKAKEPTGC